MRAAQECATSRHMANNQSQKRKNPGQAFGLFSRLVENHLVPGQNKLPAVADFIDTAQRAGLTSVNLFGGKESSTYILESTGTARRSHSEHHSRRSKAPGRLPRHFFGGN